MRVRVCALLTPKHSLFRVHHTQHNSNKAREETPKQCATLAARASVLTVNCLSHSAHKESWQLSLPHTHTHTHTHTLTHTHALAPLTFNGKLLGQRTTTTSCSWTMGKQCVWLISNNASAFASARVLLCVSEREGETMWARKRGAEGR